MARGRAASPSPASPQPSPASASASSAASAPAAAAAAPRRLRVAFLHPDLGLGGAERLVVDAAAGLAAHGCAVSVFTSHFDPARAFAEARGGAGGFRVREHGRWVPRALPLLGGLHIVLAVAQNLWLALAVALAAWRAEWRGGGADGGDDDAFDVLVCDQVSACVPLLRLLLPRAAVLFYCHYPDMLLAPRRSALQRLYRAPFDLLEELTTGLADAVLVNSRFTRAAFGATFRRLAFVEPEVLYPCIALAPGDEGARDARLAATAAEAATGKEEEEEEEEGGGGGAPIVLLSINRFERKKEIALAIRAAALLRGLLPAALARRVHLVVAGGYDTRVAENVEHHRELLALAEQQGLAGAGAAAEAAAAKPGRAARRGSSAATAAAGTAAGTMAALPAAAASSDAAWSTDPAALRRVIPDWPLPPAAAAGPGAAAAPAPGFAQTQVGARASFVRSFSDEQKRSLLRACRAVVYTPPNEHFGIVPLECAAAARPVVACASGGPLESVRDGETGLLCAQPTAAAFARALAALAADAPRARAMGRAARLHVERGFSRGAFAAQLERAAREARAQLWLRRAAARGGRARLWALLAALCAASAALAALALALLARAAWVGAAQAAVAWAKRR